MQTIYGGMLIAAAVGAITGGVIKVAPDYAGDRPLGPQQIYSQPRLYSGGESSAYGAIKYPSGAFADFVIGTDWLPGGRYNRPIEVAYAPIYEPYAPDMAALEAKYRISVDLPSPPPRETLDVQAESAADRGREAVDVIPVNSEGGGQVYDLAHGSDPDALVSEPSA